MKELERKKLDFDLTFNYFKSTLENTNQLSKLTLEIVDFKNGEFFTLLPQNANSKKIHAFDSGGILPQNPIKRHPDRQTSFYQHIPTIHSELIQFLRKRLDQNKQLLCVIDDFNSSPSDKAESFVNLFNHCGMSLEKEVYYFINKQNANKEVLLKCLSHSNTFWHSLGILAECSLTLRAGKNLNSTEIRKICSNIKLIFVGAYDGEGYVLWESNGPSASDKAQRRF